MEYNNAKSLGAVLTEVSIPYKFFTFRYQVSGADDPEAGLRAAYAWQTGFVDALIGGVPVVLDTKAPKEPEQEAHAGMLEDAETQEVDIARYSVYEKGGKYRLELYPLLDNGKAGKYAELTLVADKERMWQALQPVWDDIEKVPSDGDVNWVAEWKLGREYEGKDGKTKHYRDLVGLRIG